VQPFHVAAFIKDLQAEVSPPIVRAKFGCRLGITLFPREKPPRKRRNPWNLLLSTYCANGGLFASGRSGGRPARRIATSRATTNKPVTKAATPAQP
jgi:hypothetical protein